MFTIRWGKLNELLEAESEERRVKVDEVVLGGGHERTEESSSLGRHDKIPGAPLGSYELGRGRATAAKPISDRLTSTDSFEEYSFFSRLPESSAPAIAASTSPISSLLSQSAAQPTLFQSANPERAEKSLPDAFQSILHRHSYSTPLDNVKRDSNMLTSADQGTMFNLDLDDSADDEVPPRLLVSQGTPVGFNHFKKLLEARVFNNETAEQPQLLISACREGVVDIALYLMREEQHQIKECDKDGATALHWACASGSSLLVHMLLLNGADGLRRDHHGCTVLQYACAHHRLAVVTYLLNTQVLDLNAKDNLHMTCLHHACHPGATDSEVHTLLLLLISFGAFVDCITKFGMSAAELAQASGYIRSADTLRSYIDSRLDSTELAKREVLRKDMICGEVIELHEVEEARRTGAFGNVFFGYWTGGSCIVAVKEVMQLGRIESVTPFQRGDCDLAEQYRCLSALSCPYIVQAYGVRFARSGLQLVMECASSSLAEVIEEWQDIDLWHSLTFIQHVTIGLSFLANRQPPIIHGDLATRNLLIFVDGYSLHKSEQELKSMLSAKTVVNLLKKGASFRVKLADFGLSRVCPSLSAQAQRSLRSCGRPLRGNCRSMPPEAFEGVVHHSYDAWGWAVVVWEVFSNNQMPYAECETGEQVRQFISQGNRLAKPAQCPDSLFKLMLRCWHQEADCRPSMSEISASLQAIRDSLDFERARSSPLLSPYASEVHVLHSLLKSNAEDRQSDYL